MNTRVRHTTSLLLAAACLGAAGCSTIIEDRSDCPSYLNVEVSSRYDLYEEPGNAWCSVYGNKNALVAISEVVDVNSRDTTLTYVIDPRQPVSVIVSSAPVRSSCIVADYGDGYGAVWVTRKDADCTAEETTVRIDQLNKQFCELTVTLSRETLANVPVTGIIARSDYNGIRVPSMRPNVGRFCCTAPFDELGRATVVLPRQGGTGLTLILQIEDSEKDVPIDLYAIMTGAEYDWTDENLRDFQIEISVDKFSVGTDVEGWRVGPDKDIYVQPL